MKRKPFVRIRAADTGTKALDYLASRFTYLSAKGWRTMIDEGRVKIGLERTEADRLLKEGDRLSFDPPEIEEPPVDERISVAYEDEQYLIVNKSGSLPCHPGGRFFEHTLWRVLIDRYGEEAGREMRIATRLDRETSGLVLVCKGARAARFASSALAKHAIRKEYLAMVHGLFPDRSEAEGYLVRDEGSLVRKKRIFIPTREGEASLGGESCSTSFKLIARAALDEGAFSLLRAFPRTGKTHQIRASLLGLGFPIVGDKLYGLDEGCFLRFAEGALNEKDLSRLILPNQALHCAALSFEDEDERRVAARAEPCWPYPYGELARQASID
jgi:23S rRNA pseudouridine955/2504/2580 synthase/23S rRNA pseudouridine1911/1915/1917 synthase